MWNRVAAQHVQATGPHSGRLETTLDGADHEMRRTPGHVGSAFTFDANLKA